MLKKLLLLLFCLPILTILGCGSLIQTSSSVSVIVYEVDAHPTITSERIASMKDTLTARFKSLGFKSVVINQTENRLRVDLKPGNSDVEQMAELVGQPNRFRMVGPNDEVILSEEDLISATPSMDETYKTFDVGITDEAGKRLEAATKKLLGQRVRFYLDDRQLGDLVVSRPIGGEGFQVPGSSTVQEAKILAAILDSGGTLPISLKVVSIDHWGVSP